MACTPGMEFCLEVGPSLALVASTWALAVVLVCFAFLFACIVTHPFFASIETHTKYGNGSRRMYVKGCLVYELDCDTIPDAKVYRGSARLVVGWSVHRAMMIAAMGWFGAACTGRWCG